MSERRHKITQRIVLDVYLTAPGGKLRKSYGGELRRLQKAGFKETKRKVGERQDQVKVTLEREVERYPGVPAPGMAPYIH